MFKRLSAVEFLFHQFRQICCGFFYRVKLKSFKKFKDTTEALAGMCILVNLRCLRFKYLLERIYIILVPRFYIISFSFNGKIHVLSAATATVEGKMSKALKSVMKKLVASDIQEELAVADAKLGNVIKV